MRYHRSYTPCYHLQYGYQMGDKPDIKSKLKFTSFFKSVIVELDKEMYGPDNHLIEVLKSCNLYDNFICSCHKYSTQTHTQTQYTHHYVLIW